MERPYRNRAVAASCCMTFKLTLAEYGTLVVVCTLAVKLQLYRQKIKLINVTFVIKHFNSNLVKFGIGLHFGILFTKKFNKINRKIDTLNRPAS
jgi:hypothetical protein